MQTNKRRILVPLSLRNQHCREVFFGIGFKTARVPFLCTRNLFRFGMVEDFPTVNSGGRRIRREGASRSGRRILRNESLPVREGIARSEKFSRECGQRSSSFPFPHRCGKWPSNRTERFFPSAKTDTPVLVIPLATHLRHSVKNPAAAIFSGPPGNRMGSDAMPSDPPTGLPSFVRPFLGARQLDFHRTQFSVAVKLDRNRVARGRFVV